MKPLPETPHEVMMRNRGHFDPIHVSPTHTMNKPNTQVQSQSEVAHTSLPWRIGDAGHTIFGPKSDQPAPRMIAQMLQHGGNYEERRANAHFIVKAVNCHDDLLEACKAALLLYDLPNVDLSSTAQSVRDTILAAIAKTESRP